MKALFRFMLVLAVVPMIWSCSDDDDGTSDTTPTYTIQGSANVVVGEENLYSIPNLPAGAGVEWNVSTTDFSIETKAYNTVSVTATEAGNIAILSGIVTDGSSRLGSAAIEIRSVEAE